MSVWKSHISEQGAWPEPASMHLSTSCFMAMAEHLIVKCVISARAWVLAFIPQP